MTYQKIRKILKRLPAGFLSGVTLLLILWLTLTPRPLGTIDTTLFPGSDKVAHALMFGFFSSMICLDRTRKNGFKPLSFLFIIASATISSLTGLLIEFLQDWLPTGRSFESADILADTAGSFLAAAAWGYLQT